MPAHAGHRRGGVWAAGLMLALMVAAPAQAVADGPAAFAEARAWLDQARQKDQAARQAILDASRTRQQINAARAGRTPPGTSAPSPDDGLQQLERLQADGARWRDEADTLRRRARDRLAQGLAAGWAPWVGDTRPLTLDAEVQQFFAHNTPVRTVHPDQPPPSGALPDDTALKVHDMTLRLPMLAAQQAPTDLDIAAFQLSRDQRYLAHIEVHPDPGAAAGNAAAVPLNRLHRWRLLLADLHGRPVAGATITVGGHMPGHVHGLPTQPRVTQELAPGVYLVEGLKFQMDGWWVMQFDIQPHDPAQAPDNVAFNLVF
jgi:YtkA-like